MKPLGHFNAKIFVDEQYFEINLHVVPNNCLDVKVVIDKEFFENAEVQITPDGIKVKKILNETDFPNYNFMNIESDEKSNINIDSKASSNAKSEVLKLINRICKCKNDNNSQGRNTNSC